MKSTAKKTKKQAFKSRKGFRTARKAPVRAKLVQSAFTIPEAKAFAEAAQTIFVGADQVEAQALQLSIRISELKGSKDEREITKRIILSGIRRAMHRVIGAQLNMANILAMYANACAGVGIDA